MKLIIHRGTHQIGGSCIEVSSGDERLILDIGLPLDSSVCDNIASLPSLRSTGVLPDIKGLYADAEAPLISAVIISHSHLDHYGMIPFIHPDIPVFVGKAASEMITVSQNVMGNNLVFSNRIVNYFKSEEEVSIGSFVITPYLMDHSAFDAYAVLVINNNKKLFYTGDFRSHGRKGVLFNRLLQNVPSPVDVLITEGTMSSRNEELVRTETELQNDISRLMNKNKNLCMFWCSSQNIDRIVSIYKACKQNKRKLVVDIYTAHILSSAANYAKIPHPSKSFEDVLVYFPFHLSQKIGKLDANLLYRYKNFKITRDEMCASPDRYALQIRPSAKSFLGRMNCLHGGCLIYSMWEGYLKEKYSSDFITWLEDKGVSVHKIHTSGHAPMNEIQKLVNALRPGKLIPVHTENPAQFKSLGSDTVLLSDGEVFDF